MRYENKKGRTKKTVIEKEDVKKISADDFDSIMKKILSVPPIENKKNKMIK
ncbi:MAG: hypothetical protein ABSD50_03990 [Smithella sp.]